MEKWVQWLAHHTVEDSFHCSPTHIESMNHDTGSLSLPNVLLYLDMDLPITAFLSQGLCISRVMFCELYCEGFSEGVRVDPVTISGRTEMHGAQKMRSETFGTGEW